MTDPVVLALAVVALCMAAVAAIQLQPRHEDIAPEAAFKAVLQAHARRRGVEPSAWAPWHPHGRMPERLISHPGIQQVPGPHDDGYEPFVAALVEEVGAVARWAQWSREATCPESLTPRARLGPGYDVDSAMDGRAAAEAERRWRLSWRWIRGAPMAGLPDVTSGADDVVRIERLLSEDGLPLRSLAALRDGLDSLEEAPAWVWDAVAVFGATWSAVAFDGLTSALHERLTAEAPRDGTRWILGVTGAAAPVVLAVLADDAGLRDHVAGVVSVGGIVGGRAGEAGPWSEAASEDRLGRDFCHAFLDTEVVQVVPWAHVVWLDPGAEVPGVANLSAGGQRWPVPGFEGREPAFVEVEDLGALDARTPPDAQALREAVRVTVDLVVGTRVFV